MFDCGAVRLLFTTTSLLKPAEYRQIGPPLGGIKTPAIPLGEYM